MQKKSTILLLALSATMLAACNGVGSSGDSPQIAASVSSSSGTLLPNSCVGMTTGSWCTVTLSYNPNNIVGATLGTNPAASTLPNAITESQGPTHNGFTPTFATCQARLLAAVGTSTATCDVTIYYTSTGSIFQQNLFFTYGSTQTESAIAIAGN